MPRKWLKAKGLAAPCPWPCCSPGLQASPMPRSEGSGSLGAGCGFLRGPLKEMDAASACAARLCEGESPWHGKYGAGGEARRERRGLSWAPLGAVRARPAGKALKQRDLRGGERRGPILLAFGMAYAIAWVMANYPASRLRNARASLLRLQQRAELQGAYARAFAALPGSLAAADLAREHARQAARAARQLLGLLSGRLTE
jgi:hypothetical protein